MSASDYLEDKLGRLVLMGEAYAPPTLYLALYTTAPTDAGGGTEVVGGSYARQPVTFTTSANGVFVNGAVDFLDMPAVSIVAVGVLDAATAGNLLYHASHAATAVVAGDTYSVGAGAITVTHL